LILGEDFFTFISLCGLGGVVNIRRAISIVFLSSRSGVFAMTEKVLKPITIDLPSQDEILAAVGRGIQAFASVEHGLSMVFASIMAPAERNASFVVLDVARHIDTKMRIVQAAASVQLNASELVGFNNLLNRCKTRATLRHKLAHWTVSFWPGVQTAEEARKLKVALCPPPASPDADPTFWGNEHPIFLKEIELFRENCNKLTLELFKFSIALDKARAQKG
jgi:hypothetical protein